MGETYEHYVTITEEMITRIAEDTGDHNPIHPDRDYVMNTIFKTWVTRGMLQAGSLSGVLGNRFPGVGTIYLSQTLKYLKPVFIGD